MTQERRPISWTAEDTKAEQEGRTERKAALTEKLKKSVESVKTKKAKAKGINPEALAAVQQLDKKQLAALRQKLAGVEAPATFPKGTGEIPLSDTDIEEVEDLTAEAQALEEKGESEDVDLSDLK